jgi:phosphoglycolate phosphatase-like HAD superfamily hydrolase
LKIYVASGTDDADVKSEAKILGVAKYFDIIAGAPAGKAACSKEAVLRQLIRTNNYKGGELAVIGDGKVEIARGREFGAATLGLATDEQRRCGINETKRARLIKAGAHAIAGDFLNKDEVMDWLGF